MPITNYLTLSKLFVFSDTQLSNQKNGYSIKIRLGLSITLPGNSKVREVTQSCPTLCNPMDCSYQAPLSMGFSRQEYWSGVPSPSPGDLPDPGVKAGSPALQADTLPSETQTMTGVSVGSSQNPGAGKVDIQRTESLTVELVTR